MQCACASKIFGHFSHTLKSLNSIALYQSKRLPQTNDAFLRTKFTFLFRDRCLLAKLFVICLHRPEHSKKQSCQISVCHIVLYMTAPQLISVVNSKYLSLWCQAARGYGWPQRGPRSASFPERMENMTDTLDLTVCLSPSF